MGSLPGMERDRMGSKSRGRARDIRLGTKAWPQKSTRAGQKRADVKKRPLSPWEDRKVLGEVGQDAEDEAEGFWKTRVDEETEGGLCEVLLHPVGGEQPCRE